MILTFNKEENNWYIDIPEWKGHKSELQMVMGADTMLDEISKGKNKVSMYASLHYFDSAEAMQLSRIEFDGATYVFRGKEMWLCEVTKSIFGSFPNYLYVSVLPENIIDTDDLLDEIFEISISQEGKSLQELTLKCAEEVGELAQAVLSYTGAPGCKYKELKEEDVIEELADVFLVNIAMAAKLNITKEDLKIEIKRKLNKWVEKMSN